MLGSRFRLQRISKKNTLHLCKATLTVCTPDLKAPDLHWTIGIFGNPDFMLSSIFLSPSSSGSLTARTAIKKDNFQPRKLALSP